MKKTSLIAVAFVLTATVMLAGAARLDEGRGGGVVPAVAMPVPAGALAAGCIASGPAALICGGVLVTGILCYMYCDDIADWIMEMAGHRTNVRESNRERHEKADARRKREQERAKKRGGKGGKGGKKK